MTSPLGRAALRFDNPKHDLPEDADLVTGRDMYPLIWNRWR